MAASKDKARAILSYATPNPVGPYRLVTPPTPVGPSKTKTPILPVVGGSLINVPLPQMPSKTSNAPAQDVGQRKQINVPTPVTSTKNKQKLPYWDDDLASEYDRLRTADVMDTTTPKDMDRMWEIQTGFHDSMRYAKEENHPLAKLYFKELKDYMRDYAGITPEDSEYWEIGIQGMAPQFIELVTELRGVPKNRYAAAAKLAVGGSTLDVNAVSRAAKNLDKKNWDTYVSIRDKARGYVEKDVLSALPQVVGFTKAQRETFDALLPEWEGTLEELAITARSLGG